ncbi:MAG: hypothetical protein JNL43_00790 [Flavobacteriales bacterium]|nr:hypothetical protein [Flavobacteriales bacterium]
MASKVPTTRSIAWISLVPQLCVMVVLIGALHLLDAPQPSLFGMVAYLLLSITLRLSLTAHHRKGIQDVKAGLFEKAIPWFEKSVAYFERRPWLDRYRYLLLLSSSAWSYREMGMANRAFCLSQMGRRTEAIAAYEAVLKEFPESTLAIVALRMLAANDTPT